GDFKNAGREWQPQGEPEEVRVHDFMDKTLGKAIPYGAYDITENQGRVSVGIDHDTARFAAEAIRRWWWKMGNQRYKQPREWWIAQRAVAAMGAGVACGKRRSMSWSPTWRCPSRCVTFPRGRVSGTKLSIGCSLTSPKTGGVVPW